MAPLHGLLASAMFCVATACGAAAGEPPLSPVPPPTAPSSPPSPAANAPIADGKDTQAAEWTPLKSKVVLGIPLVEGRVGETVAWFVLDTGTTASCFDEHWAREHNLDVIVAPPTKPDLVGRSRVRRAAVEIGPTTLEVRDSPCFDFRDYSKMFGIPIAGFLGHDFFAERTVRIRYSEQGVDLGASKRPAIASGSFLIPISLVDKFPFTMIVLSQESRPATGASAMIDTGFSGAILVSAGCASRMEFKADDGDGIKALFAQGIHQVRQAHAVSLDLGRTTPFSLVADIDDGEMPFEALMGSEVLSQFVVVIDYPHRVFVLSRQGKSPGKGRGTIGFGLTSSLLAGDHTVSTVDAGGKAELAGLRGADILLGINGQDVTKSAMGEVNSAMREAIDAGGTLVLRVRRGEQILEIKIDLEAEKKGPER